MANTLTITVENPTALLDSGLYGSGALIRTQSSATEAGAYADITGTGSDPTIAIVADQRAYTVNDPNGTSSTWYRTRYENAGATRVSDWSTSFQAGDETGGLLCSLYDVKQDLGISESDTTEDENLLEKIRQVSAMIEGYTERWFAPRPASGTGVYRFHSVYGRRLFVPRGLRSIATLGIATTNQPESGGSYTTVAAADYYLDPPDMARSPGWPATWVRMPSTSAALFYDAVFGIQITGAFGWASVPYDIQAIAIGATIRKFMGKESAAPAVAIGPTGAVTILRDIGPADMLTLERYRVRPV